MTEERDWRKIKYYPVSIEKLMKASMREVAYLIAPMNIGEDYEYFDEVKHLLVIPEPPKTLEQISQELKQKGDEIIENFKQKSINSQHYIEYRCNPVFERIIENFEYAVKNGSFPPRLTLTNLDFYKLRDYSASNLERSFVIKQGQKHEGYYTFGNRRYFKYYIPDKPNMIVRFFMKICLGFFWVDEKNA